MKLTNLIGFVAIGVVIPSTILAGNNSALADVKVSTPNVEAITRSDGSVYVNSGGTTVQVPSHRRYWTPWRYWRLPWQNLKSERSNCRQTSYQATTRITPSSSKIIQSSVASNGCN
ncbi:hypothetical protein I4641_11000 [Waterburya agarophytonicola K14]|uniref:Uncharacterized protein n=1 Tax=Waterburya agarophytonicola KI4 TaxID=2874699 RepID=A0A964FF89_9CYAN|nr:hypothetical protein [Waterburya agarophytonicola]MCC0177505.1 hypothetical protein [Waterburya agarophytonicola KI4]